MIFRSNEICFRCNVKKREIAFTFDDGPHPVHTHNLLQLFGKYNLNCTFFLTGAEIDKFPGLVKDISDQQQEIGNHGYHHQSYLLKTYEQVLTEIKMTDEVLLSLGVAETTLFRPPYFHIPIIFFLQRKSIGKKIIMSSHRIKDFRFQRADKLADAIRKKIKPGVILPFHDGLEQSGVTVKALSQLIPELLDQGYFFRTVSQLLSSFSNPI